MLNKLRYPIRSLIGATAVILSTVGSILLVYRAATEGTVWHVVSFSIYGTSLITVWTVSTIYHSLNVPSNVNKILKQLDHAMIYFLIAGTYTPICLVVLHGGWGWSLLSINWTFAITGIVLKLVFRNPSWWTTVLFFILYILMGWLIVVAWFPLLKVFSSGGVFWLILGGFFYTVGLCFFGRKHLNFSPQFGAHEIWHLFVMAGSFCHFWMMFKYIL